MQSFLTITGVIKMRLDGQPFPLCQVKYHIGSGTAQDIMRKYQNLGTTFDQLMEMPPSEVEQLFYPSLNTRHLKISIPDFEALFNEVVVGKHKVKKKELWDAYHQKEPDGFQRTQFLEYYNRYLLERFGPDDLTMGVNRVPGERVFIDYCGDKAILHISSLSKDPLDLTEQFQIHLFVTTCGFSSKLYAEASLDEKQAQFNGATANALTYYGAVPRYLVPDNLRTGVTVNTKDKVVINASYQDLESFYDTIVLPPPYWKPKGKATAERYVQVVENKIIKALEKQYVFQTMDDVNACVMDIVENENNTIPQGYTQTHNEMFELYDKPAMKPLKDGRFLNCEYSFCPKVPSNYHVMYDGHSYSVPYRYYGAMVVVKATREEIILCDVNNREITRHKRCYIPAVRYITKPEHMPANHRYYLEVNERDSAYYLKWAESIGPNMRQLLFTILKSANHDEQMYTACNSILHMCDGVPGGINEEAAAICIQEKRCTYHQFKGMLSDLLKQRRQSSITAVLPDTENIRGKDYYK